MPSPIIQTGSPERWTLRKFLHLVVHQRDIRRIHGDIAAYTAHSDAYLRHFQCRRVVDAVADHTDRLSGTLDFVDIIQLILRQTVGTNLPNVKLRRNSICRVLMIASQQNRLDL